VITTAPPAGLKPSPSPRDQASTASGFEAIPKPA
jgi:hypothetical protein